MEKHGCLRSEDPVSDLPDETQVFSLLNYVRCPKNIIQHCISVSKIALDILSDFEGRVETNRKLVYVGALLHDVGRTITHGINHGVVGAVLLRHHGFPYPIAMIAERHIGAGIPAEEAWALGLPRKDYLPTTIEEKLVTYSDKLLMGTKRITAKESMNQLAKILGAGHPALARFKQLHEEISKLRGKI